MIMDEVIKKAIEALEELDLALMMQFDLRLFFIRVVARCGPFGSVEFEVIDYVFMTSII